jgi:peptide/nickel transport system substrate-binding protein
MSDWTDLQRALTEGRLTRRRFMRLATMLGVSSGMVGSVLARSALAEEPVKGGHLIVALNGAGASDTLNPGNYTATFMQVIGHQVYNTLIELDQKNLPQPALAESWEPKPGAKEWVIKIRKGVTFSNGKPLTAADVIYTLNFHGKADSTSAAKPLVGAIKEMKATDTHEITFTLAGADADFPYTLADYHLCIGPENSNFLDGIGTGPYILDELEPGVRAATHKNPNYWRTDRAFVESVETLAVNDDTARFSALLSGSAHLINRVDPASVASLEKNADLQVFEISGAAHYTFPMRCNMKPFDNNDVRLAMKYALDREALLRNVLNGHGKIGNDIPVPSYDPFYAADIPQRPYDPDKAKFHMKKSGYDGPITFSISDGAFTGALNAAQLFQQSAAKAGINIELEQVPADSYWDDTWLKKPLCASYWDGRPTQDAIFSVVYKSGAPWNESAWSNAKFDKILDEARGELDPAKRKTMYHELQQLVYDDCGELIGMFNNTIDAGSKKVKGFVQKPILQFGGYRAPEQVWLEA